MSALVDYALVVLFASFVASGELVSRYRDAPLRAVWNRAAIAYVAVNAAAAISALYLVRVFGLTLGAQDPTERQVLQVLLAGFGALAFFRASLFVVHTEGRDIGVGPITLLQVLLFATDRGVDRRRATDRAKAVTGALRGLSFPQVQEALPRYCLTLMQNVSKEEESQVHKQLEDISNSDMEDTLKVNALGLAMMNVVGQQVLVAAADAVKQRILLERGVFGEVYPRLHQVVHRIEKAEHKSLDVLGLTLYTAWPHIKSWLEEDRSPLNGWKIVLRVLDPKMLTGTGTAWFDADWAEEAQRSIVDVSSYISDNYPRLNSREIKLSISTYELVPAFHGFRVANDSYFISFVWWDKGTGKVGRPLWEYEFFPPDDTSRRARLYKRLFDNWLEQIDAASVAASRIHLERDAERAGGLEPG